jgi:EAL domain-containing protein (putative c-di-GMP-specific phosphodiesterase class I)/GGDEF domain-containing protein
LTDRSEDARLAALHQLDLLDSPPSEAFDRITRMAAQFLGLPIAAIVLTDRDRQWFKSRIGLDSVEIPRLDSPCSQVVETAEALVVADLTCDDRYRNGALAQSGVRFYAGEPLITREGLVLGTLCVMGYARRAISATQSATLRDLAAMAMAQVELQHAYGRVDPLSGMPNRNQFVDDLDDLARARQTDEQRLAVLVDVAKSEQLSHAIRAVGARYLDDLVRQAARTMRGLLGPGQRIYHVASTQFAFLAPAGVDQAAYIGFLEDILREIHDSAGMAFLTISTIGVAPFALGQISARDVLRTAHGAAEDAWLTVSKVGVHSADHDAAHRRRFMLLNDFGAALESDEQLRLVYQPRLELMTGTCVGAEALLRWTHPVLGDVSPGEFIPLIERTSLAKQTTAWVLDAALKQLAAWRKAGLKLQLSVNISAANLEESDFADCVQAGLVRRRVPAEALELEITESAVMEDSGRALAQLEAIAASGVRLAIDDFGTGYSSLSYLQRLPVHVVKIDRSFMNGLENDERLRTLVSTMISLSHDLGYSVVAEGVETEAVSKFLAAESCDEAQGYFFGRPMTPADFAVWLKQSAKVSVAA